MLLIAGVLSSKSDAELEIEQENNPITGTGPSYLPPESSDDRKIRIPSRHQYAISWLTEQSYNLAYSG